MAKEMARFLILSLVGFLPLSHAALVGIIDSGTDYLHRELKDQHFHNALDYSVNGVDEDGNGYLDDVWGWNFTKQNSEIIDRSFHGFFGEDISRFFHLMAMSSDGTELSEDEKQWLKEKGNDTFFRVQLLMYGNYVHGTHVAHIASGTEKHPLIGLKIIPTTPFHKDSQLPATKYFSLQSIREVNLDDQQFETEEENKLRWKALQLALSELANEQKDFYIEIAKYLNAHQVTVANGSFGTGPEQVAGIVSTAFLVIFQRQPEMDELIRGVAFYLSKVLIHAKHLATLCPNTLFVFAAGNDGFDNDVLPTAPASIGGNNVLSVAAAHTPDVLANFSNFGKRSVHLAALGVNIESAVPGDEYLRLSGTSQAAPQVTRVAASVQTINPKLKPQMVREIILKTVTLKEHLKNITVTGGMLNEERAKLAARYSLTMNLSSAIDKAMQELEDSAFAVQETRTDKPVGDVFVLPLASPIF